MKKKNKGSRSWSRILAVQALYQLYLNRDANKNIVIKSLLQNKESKNKADKNFFLKLVKETLEKQKILEDKIILASNKRKFNKMETLLKIILELGTLFLCSQWLKKFFYNLEFIHYYLYFLKLYLIFRLLILLLYHLKKSFLL